MYEHFSKLYEDDRYVVRQEDEKYGLFGRLEVSGVSSCPEFVSHFCDMTTYEPDNTIEFQYDTFEKELEMCLAIGSGNLNKACKAALQIDITSPEISVKKKKRCPNVWLTLNILFCIS